MRAILLGEAFGALVVALTTTLPLKTPPASSPEVPREEVPALPPVIDPDAVGALNILAEGRGEPLEGQIAIGVSVRERMRRRYNGSDGTVIGTVFAPKQYSWTNHTDPQRITVLQRDDQDPAYKRAMEAWRASEHVRPAGNAVLYHTEQAPKGVATWPPQWTRAASVRFVKKLGNHLFYEDEG